MASFTINIYTTDGVETTYTYTYNGAVKKSGFYVSNNYIMPGMSGTAPVAGVVPTDTIISGGQYSVASGVDD